jgi:hypothetical protein
MVIMLKQLAAALPVKLLEFLKETVMLVLEVAVGQDRAVGPLTLIMVSSKLGLLENM